jgi:hypothetical protein
MIDPFDEITALKNSHHELVDLLKKNLANPPKFTVDSASVAEILAQKIPNPTGMVEAIAKEIKSLEVTVNRIPKSIEVKGDVYGFTSQKPLLAYWMLMIFTVFLSASFYFRSSDNEQIKEYKRLVEDFRQKNPKLADKYFGNWYQRNIESPVKELFQK